MPPGACLCCLTSLALGLPSHERGVASRHHAGPSRLEGWTLGYRLPEDDGGMLMPTTLIIIRRGQVLQKIEADSFVGAWMFQADGSQVAFESGPLHGSLTCVLVDLASGKKVANYDCFRDLPPDAPTWVKALENGSTAFQPDEAGR